MTVVAPLLVGAFFLAFCVCAVLLNEGERRTRRSNRADCDARARARALADEGIARHDLYPHAGSHLRGEKHV